MCSMTFTILLSLFAYTSVHAEDQTNLNLLKEEYSTTPDQLKVAPENSPTIIVENKTEELDSSKDQVAIEKESTAPSDKSLAQDDHITSTEECIEDTDNSPDHAPKKEELSCAYSAPARVNCKGTWDLFFSGSFIYWRSGQGQMDLATLTKEGTPQETSAIFQDQKYAPGFKASLGIALPRDDWTAQVQYTHLHTSTLQSITLSEDQTLTANTGWSNFSPLTPLSSLTTDWKLRLNIFDGELRRWFYSGKELLLTPFFGPRFGWLKQRMLFQPQVLASGTISDQRLRASSWLLGARGGLNASWLLSWGFKTTGKLATSLFYQRQKVTASLRDLNDNAFANLSETTHLLNPNLELGCGLGWSSYFFSDHCHFNLHAAYEFHYYWNQNVIRSSLSRSNTVGTAVASIDPADLSLHGVTVTAKFDF